MHTPQVPFAATATEQSPTTEVYAALRSAYDHFNAALFAGKLPACLITLQRKGRRTFGYYAARRFGSVGGGTADEIALNPRWFKERPPVDVMSTLVHEMVHLWQDHFGNPSRAGYHNREWAGEMLRIGLYPSHTGQPGGRMTGQQMTHYMIADGRFATAAQQLLAKSSVITWFDVDAAVLLLPKGLDEFLALRPKAGKRAKFCCPQCGVQAWGKPSLNLICGECEQGMRAEPGL